MMKFLKMVVSSCIIVGTNGLSIRYTAVMDENLWVPTMKLNLLVAYFRGEIDQFCT